MELNREYLMELKEWLESDTIDDPEELFDSDNIEMILELIDFWLEHN